MTKLALEIFAIVRIPAVQSEDSIFNQLSLRRLTPTTRSFEYTNAGRPTPRE